MDSRLTLSLTIKFDMAPVSSDTSLRRVRSDYVDKNEDCRPFKPAVDWHRTKLALKKLKMSSAHLLFVVP